MKRINHNYANTVRLFHRKRHHMGDCPSDVHSKSQPAPSDMLSGLALEKAILYNANRKIADPPDKTLFLAIMAGIWVGIGGMAGISAAGGVPDSVRKEWVSLPRFLIGSFFVFALHFITMFGGELFTGNLMILAIGHLNKELTLLAIVQHTTIVYIGNWGGTLLVAYFVGYLTKLFDTVQYRSFLAELVIGKLEGPNWGEIFLRAIPANIMVCMAIFLALAARSASGKIIALWFPVVMFVLSGYEHCIANMIFLSVGLMYGAPSSIGRLWYNQSAAVCGNLVGGAIFIGLTAHLSNHWESWIFSSSKPGTFQGHDVESTRHAQDSHKQYKVRQRKPSRPNNVSGVSAKQEQQSSLSVPCSGESTDRTSNNANADPSSTFVAPTPSDDTARLNHVLESTATLSPTRNDVGKTEPSQSKWQGDELV